MSLTILRIFPRETVLLRGVLVRSASQEPALIPWFAHFSKGFALFFGGFLHVAASKNPPGRSGASPLAPIFRVLVGGRKRKD